MEIALQIAMEKETVVKEFVPVAIRGQDMTVEYVILVLFDTNLISNL